MSLSDLIGTSSSDSKAGSPAELTPERIKKNLGKYQHIIAYWRLYPDKLIDWYCSLNPNNKFHFYWYQRMMLRAMMRHKYTYMVFCRAYSKSFIGVMSMMLKAVLYPGLKIFTVAEGKQQSASIVQSKLSEICTLIPALSKEIVWDTRGTSAVTRQSKDSVTYTFKNGSILENVVCNENARGKRYTAGNLEEAATLPQDMLEKAIIPTLNSPRMVNGEIDENEAANQSQCFVTSAGYKSTYAYRRLIEILTQSLLEPDRAFILGGDWRVPVRFGAFSKDFMQDLKSQGDFNAATFDREYNSRWTGAVEAAFFNADNLNRNRINKIPEYAPNGRNNSRTYYIMGVDVGRSDCTTEVCILKVSPASTGTPLKQLVNIQSIEAENFTIQAIKIKKIFLQYNCKCAVVDGNGVGTGLIDLLVTDTTDPDTGEIYYNWGVYNDDKGAYRKNRTPDTIANALYVMKATAALNSEMYAYTQTQLQHGKIKFLVDENVAKVDRMNKATWKKKRSSERVLELQPYVLTSNLIEEMLNLVETEDDKANIVLKPASKKIKHDKFSALIYGLYYCKIQEDRGGHKKRDLSKFIFYTKK